MVRLIQALLLAVVGALAIAASPVQAGVDIVKEIVDRGKLVVLVTNSPPYSYKEPGSDTWTGYNVELARLAADVLEVDLEVVEGPWATLIPSLQARQVDFIGAALSMTPVRASLVRLTDPIAYSGHHLVIRADDTRFTSYESFNDPSVTIAVFPNASETVVRENFPNATIKIITSDNTNAPRLEVLAGRADASVTDFDTATQFVAANPTAKVFPGAPFRSTPVVWAVRSDDEPLAHFLNILIADRRGASVIHQLGEKYKLRTEP